jgi:hypothetical protein
VLASFSESPENQTASQLLISSGLWVADEQVASVARLYDPALDRTPDSVGLHSVCDDCGDVPEPAIPGRLTSFNKTYILLAPSFLGGDVDDVDDEVAAERSGRRAAFIRAAEERGLLGAKDRQLGGRFSDALIDEAKRVSGITENTDLLTYALIKVALEDDFGERLLARKGRIPQGTLFAG